ncbi:cytochrome P450 family protein [Wenjunlia tyrosinilytica]|uniref:Cytochrome P450 n=1 Tax=Wenjunlia tyrosinilytica TaxID=1544741 RepID=A0A918E072_9ACTN|nr:cytochrome P450 [Wenjunlia tyrosinilytica]GGO92072.1 cytochrome P450 [Wenjunlia tyrosinilytica]
MVTQKAAESELQPVPVPPDFGNNPHPFLASLRELGAAVPVVLPDGTPSWWITRYDAVDAALNDHARFSNEVHHAVGREEIKNSQALIRKDPMLRLVMINRDPPDHTRMRKLVVQAFNARAVDNLRPRLERLAESLFDGMSTEDEVELVERFAFPFPVGVICELLGIPHEDSNHFGGLVTQLVGAGKPEDALSAIRQLKDFMAAKLEEKRAAPGDDVLSGLVEAADEHNLLSEDELPAHALQLLTAGHETSIYLISGGMFRLLQHPDQLAALKKDPGLLAGAIDELLRFDPPPIPGVFRYATEDVEVDGVTVPKGSLVILCLASANRDSTKFEDPDRLDILRRQNPHLAFGNGIHYCLGARLARLEGTIALGGLLRRFPDIGLAVPPEEIRWRPLHFLQRLDRLPVRLR